MRTVTDVNMQAFLLFAIIFRFSFLDLSWFSYFAFLISIYQFCRLFLAVNHFIPFRHLSAFLMCLQMLIGPAFAYNGLDDFQEGYNKMQISEAAYFSFVLPAVICFILGLRVFSENQAGERVDMERIKSFVAGNPTLPYVLIAVGFFSSFFASYFSSDLLFVFTVLACFKFVGMFLIVLGNRYIKPLPLIIVYGSIISSSIAQGMFFDLITWLTFLGAVYALKYKPSNYFKGLLVFVFLIMVIVIQQLKGDYREATWRYGEEANIETVKKSLKKKEEKTGVFSFESIGTSNLRINQGYIITNIMVQVPDRVAFENGEELRQILEAAFLPRILAPNKLNSGDRAIFMKYSGIPVLSGTSMALSSVGDAYVNFGIWGGCLFMFFYGLLFSVFLVFFKRSSYRFPSMILFACVAFYYPIRPDCELQTILGHLFKSTLIIIVLLNIYRGSFEQLPGMGKPKMKGAVA